MKYKDLAPAEQAQVCKVVRESRFWAPVVVAYNLEFEAVDDDDLREYEAMTEGEISNLVDEIGENYSFKYSTDMLVAIAYGEYEMVDFDEEDFEEVLG